LARTKYFSPGKQHWRKERKEMEEEEAKYFWEIRNHRGKLNYPSDQKIKGACGATESFDI